MEAFDIIMMMKPFRDNLLAGKRFATKHILLITFLLVSAYFVYTNIQCDKVIKIEQRKKSNRPEKSKAFVVSHLKDHGHDYIVVENEHGIYFYHAAHCEMKDYGYDY